MSAEPATVRAAAPNEMRDPLVRAELKRASVWFGLAIGLALLVLLIQPLTLIFAGLVFAAMLDGGARLLGRVLSIPRGLRVTIVLLSAIAFVAGVFYMTGVQISAQWSQLQVTLEAQGTRFVHWLSGMGFMPAQADLMSFGRQLVGSVGKLTGYVGTVFGVVSSVVLVVAFGLFIALEPRLYQRGLAWLVPSRNRGQAEITLDRMAHTLRRLMAGRLAGMLFEGVLTWIALSIGNVPMALLLGILTGLLAFIPNIGAFVSGVLMVAVGFSAGVDTGLWAIGTYFAVQTFDGYVMLPYVARKTVDMPPAITLGAQILLGTLLGFMGLLLADSITAMIKVALERGSEREEEKAAEAG
ncbi:AI-2E family transporter [Sphingomonas sp. MAH-20]|uniref:AI-2E family transporter n=1 Tax=Sphingomonas horti TaxID=2682842 RepID=A0A6I4J2P5_9SPHN|nr:MULTISPECIES: AI-2E family transporter [Sphingomonas]MBA2920786.1 AI-2E family transporter [Sphingomonas sp. CGMCC 1.13658]MVO77721.1 AI-2E family transporter [Sphingomonas horti]